MSIGLLRVLALALWVLLPGRAFAEPPQKLALVIANSDYDGTIWTKLRNPINDAKLINGALQSAGFRTLTPAVNLSRDRLLARLDEFRAEAAKLPENSIAWVYYSGHAIQISGENYVVPIGAASPVDAESLSLAEREALLTTSFVSLGQLLSQFGTVRRTMQRAANVLVLDACRTNPLSGSERARSGPSLTRGLADVPNVANALIGFAAAPGTVADDGAGENSPYAEVLAPILARTDLPLELMFNAVSSGVLARTSGKQRPDYRVGLAGIYCLSECAVGGVATVPTFTATAAPIRAAPAICEYCPEFVPLRHRKNSLLVAKTQVTVGQWRRCVAELGCSSAEMKDSSETPSDRPVTGVSWKGAQEYVAWVRSKTGDNLRLPTSEEWEQIARLDRTHVADARRLQPVNSFAPGPSGVIAISGHVMEWTEDCSPPQATSCELRIARGRGYQDPTADPLSAQSYPPSARGSALSFRIIKIEDAQ